MDGISVASAVTGLLQAGEKVIGFLYAMADAPSTARDVLTEVRALQAIFHQLHVFTSASNRQSASQGSRIQLRDLAVTLTGCIRTFSELDVKLRELGTGTDGHGAALTTFEKARWAMGHRDIVRVLRNLQMHKTSLGLMVSIYSWFVVVSNSWAACFC